MKKSILLLGILMLVGCGHKIQTQEYYLKHLDEAKQVKKQCEEKYKTIQEYDADENCINAGEAIYKNYLDQQAKAFSKF